jgi:hypothetical protein
MEKIWKAYDKDVGDFVDLVNPEFVRFGDGSKAVMGESEITGKLLHRVISSEEAREHFQK